MKTVLGREREMDGRVASAFKRACSSDEDRAGGLSFVGAMSRNRQREFGHG